MRSSRIGRRSACAIFALLAGVSLLALSTRNVQANSPEPDRDVTTNVRTDPLFTDAEWPPEARRVEELERIIEELMEALKVAEEKEHSHRHHHGGAFEMGLERAADELANEEQNSAAANGLSNPTSSLSGSGFQPNQSSKATGQPTPGKGALSKGLHQLSEWWHWKHHHHYAEFHHIFYPYLPGRKLSVTMRPNFRTPPSNSAVAAKALVPAAPTVAKLPSTNAKTRSNDVDNARRFHEAEDLADRKATQELLNQARHELQKYSSKAGKTASSSQPRQAVTAHHVGSSVGSRGPSQQGHPSHSPAPAGKKS
jgi:hypothetical protein